MRKKGLVAFGLAAVMTASALTGCGGASDKKDSGKKERSEEHTSELQSHLNLKALHR